MYFFAMQKNTIWQLINTTTQQHDNSLEDEKRLQHKNK